MLLACDLALAAADARIGDQHANFGLMPGGGSTQRLPRRIGMQRAMELLTTGRWLSGAEAADWGLVLRAVPPGGAGRGTGDPAGAVARQEPGRAGLD